MRLNIISFFFRINSLVILYRLRIMLNFYGIREIIICFLYFTDFCLNLLFRVLQFLVNIYLDRSFINNQLLNNVKSTVKFLASFKKYFYKCWNLEELILKLTGNGVKYSRIFRDALKYSRHDQRIIALAMNFYKNSSEYRVFKLSR